MDINWLRLVMLMSLFLSLNIDANTDKEKHSQDNLSQIARKCQALHGDGACGAYARRSGATLYSRTDLKSRVIKQKQFGTGMAMFEPAVKMSSATWVPIYAVVDGPEGPNTKAITAYVRRADVILDTDFRKVTGCWPVKHLKDPEGGYDYYPGEVYFNLQGVGRPPRHPVSDVEYGEQHIYYAEGVFTVRHTKYSNRHLYGHGVLDYAKRTVLYTGTTPLKEGEQLQWFTPDELKGCKDIPTTDPNSRAPNPKLFREGLGG